jgi:hypothetical protein
MVRRALELREALDTYAAKLNVLKEPLDVETFRQDYPIISTRINGMPLS